MKRRSLSALLLSLALGAGAVYLTWHYARPEADDGHGHARPHGAHDDPDDQDEAPPKGVHGGRLLSEGEFALELSIFERGVPPEFRAYPVRAGQPVPLTQVQLTVTLQRLGGRTQTIRFAPEGDYLLGDAEVVEPHSYTVVVNARHEESDYQWKYFAFDDRTELPAAAATRAGVTTGIAGPATLRETLTVSGRVTLNEDTLTRVTPRYAGLVRSVTKQLGETVPPGDVVAVIEANESLQAYEVRAMRGGTVIARNAAAGEFAAAGDTLYTLADLSTVWIELLRPAGRRRAGATRAKGDIDRRRPAGHHRDRGRADAVWRHADPDIGGEGGRPQRRRYSGGRDYSCRARFNWANTPRPSWCRRRPCRRTATGPSCF
ncbi:MAG: efflux RND transporter periplasmic adaptor subunit [Rhodobacteraceae bacterium]|nr:efflux RND transporter periplasmic adaptor subunit [Paracoccaceae bacterium]